MIEEIWKDIKDYEGLYQASTYGRIKRFNKDKRFKSFKILKPLEFSAGHVKVTLWKNCIRNRQYIHRLILETFIGICPPGMECRHLDGNPKNNRLDNLLWGTRSENSKDSVKHGVCPLSKMKGFNHYLTKRAGLNDLKIRIIIKLIKDKYLTYKEIGEIFHISQATISNIKNRKLNSV